MSDDKKSKIFIKKKDENIIRDKEDDFYEYDMKNSKSEIVDSPDYDYFDRLESVDYNKFKREKEQQENIEIFESSGDEKTYYNSDLLFEDKLESDKPMDSNVEIKKEDSKGGFYDSLFEEEIILEKKPESVENKIPEKVEYSREEDDFSSTIVINKINERDIQQKSGGDFPNTYYLEDDEDDDYGSLYDSDYEPERVDISDSVEYVDRRRHLVNTDDEFEDDELFEDEFEDEDFEECYYDKKGKKKKKRKIFKTFLKIVGLFLLSCGILAVYFGLTHSLFKVDYIQIVGNVTNSKEVLEQKSGITLGDNIFLVSKSSVVNNLKEIPTVEEVKVTKDFPNIITIEVKEKYVSSFINNNSGITTIDNHGKVQEINGKIQATTGIQLKGITANGLVVGEDFTKDKAKKDMILELSSKDYFLDVVSVDFSNDKEVVMELKSSIKVQFGDLNDFSKKLDIISKLLEKIKSENIIASEIILNVGENPIIVKK